MGHCRCGILGCLQFSRCDWFISWLLLWKTNLCCIGKLPLEKSNSDTEITSLLPCFALYFDATQTTWEDLCWFRNYLPYTCGTVGTASRKRDTWFPTPNPSGIVKTGINGTGVSSTQRPGPQNCLVFPREGEWIKYLNVCPVVYSSILSSCWRMVPLC